MSRFNVWLLCCAVVMFTLGVMGGDVNIRALLNIFAVLGAPLLLHWSFSSLPPTKEAGDV